jgi:NAD(P)-dependent dehydrogenase (short-subunit alcohol dehydrogenase family)|tara:strand:- start:3236 stop:4150 length:915 start_codon:yes stop_codon:yes gene_type:complete
MEDKMTISFKDKVVIVTGAGGGLGRSHSLEFAKRGAKVVVNDLGGSVDGSGGSSDAANNVVKEITEAGGVAIPNGSSVTDDDGVKNMVDQTMDEFGRIDILINNAGILRDRSFTKMTMEDFTLVTDIHLMGSVKPTKMVWEIMKEQNYGRILVTTSSTGLYGNFGQSNYGAAKLGVVGFVNTLKLEGQKYNINCNVLCPVAYTRMTENLMPPEAEQLLTPGSVTPAVIYLSSENGPTGTILCAGAGVYSVAKIMESDGENLGLEASAEDLEKNWDKISDFSEAKPFFNGGEQTGKVLEKAMKGI